MAKLCDHSISTVNDTYIEDAGKDLYLTLINTNARSLCPKIESLVTCMDELEASFGVVTGTWLSSSPGLTDDLEDIRGSLGLACLLKIANLMLTGSVTEE